MSFKKHVHTLAVGSADLIALNAAKDAVPPPINKYGTSEGISLEIRGSLTGSLLFFFFTSLITSFIGSFSKNPDAHNYDRINTILIKALLNVIKILLTAPSADAVTANPIRIAGLYDPHLLLC